MNTQRSVLQASFTALAVAAGGIVFGQEVAQPARPAPAAATPNVPRAELLVLSAIRAHPLTGAYPISVTWRKGAVVLSGGVGTKEVHDVAVRLAIAAGSPVRDDLVIDTGLAHAVSVGAAAAGAGMSAFPRVGSSSPYIYPPPLMGRLDDPFFGYVPPLVSFPPWWRRRIDSYPMPRPGTMPGNVAPGNAGPGNAAPANAGPGTLAQNGAPAGPNGAPGGWQPFDVAPVQGQVDITVDASGQVFLRGVVTSEAAGREIEEAARSVPGVSRVQSQFQVIPRRAGDENPPPREGDPVEPRRVGADDPPPPPEPMVLPGEPERPAPGSPAPGRAKALASAPAALDAQKLTQRVVASLGRRAPAAELPVKVRSSDATVMLTGRVPSAYEAMIVYRAAQQTPGVHEIVDRLEFSVPDEDHPNPLIQKGRPEDLEPYLGSQIRRHVGDLAHIDRIQAHGDTIAIHGTLSEGQDRDRLLAILRSIPVLHGFRLEAELTPE